MSVVLVDTNNLGFSGMANPTLSVGGRDTQAIFSVIKRMRSILTFNNGANVICLWDGRSWRKSLDTTYKANREVTEEQRLAREAYFEQQKYIKRGLNLLGIRQVSASNMEADDMAAMLSKKYSDGGEKVKLITADKDWLQLIDKNISWFDIIRVQECDCNNFQSFTDTQDIEEFIETKCILGDVSDNIKGISGVGPKTLQNVYKLYDSFYHLLDGLNSDRQYVTDIWQDTLGKKLPKVLRELNTLEALETLNKNKILIDLHTTERPKIDRIDNISGKLDKQAFEEFCYENSFLSITKDLDRFLEPFENNKYVNK